MTDLLVATANTERRDWHRVTAISTFGHGWTRYELACAGIERPYGIPFFGTTGEGFIDDHRDKVVTAAEAVDAAGRPRGHSPVRNQVRLCQGCFGPRR